MPHRTNKRSSAARLGPPREETDLLWLRDELAFAWRAARQEAADGYRAWAASPGVMTYAVYRAAQDREDRAQDELAGEDESRT